MRRGRSYGRRISGREGVCGFEKTIELQEAIWKGAKSDGARPRDIQSRGVAVIAPDA